jgi:hypothetical protein
MRFCAIVSETLEREIVFEAENEQEAKKRLYDAYHRGNLQLTLEDCVDSEYWLTTSYTDKELEKRELTGEL